MGSRDPDIAEGVLRELRQAWRGFQGWCGRSQLSVALGVSPTEVDRALLALAAEGRVERMLSESGHTIREVWRIRHAVHLPVAAE